MPVVSLLRAFCGLQLFFLDFGENCLAVNPSKSRIFILDFEDKHAHFEVFCPKISLKCPLNLKITYVLLLNHLPRPKIKNNVPERFAIFGLENGG